MALSPELQDIHDELREKMAAIHKNQDTLINDVQRKQRDIESRLDALAFNGGGGNGATPRDERALWMPSGKEIKAQAISTDPGGGYLVPEQNADLFFDRLRPQSVVLAAGPRRYAMKTDREVIPAIDSSVTAYNPGEGGSITDSSIAFKAIALQSRKYVTRTVGSSEWFSDANPDARRLVQADHERQLAAALDRDMLQGAGTGNTLLGFRNVSGATVTTLGSGSGAVATLDDVLAAIGRMETNNATPSAIFMHPRTWSLLRKEKDVSNGRYQLTPNPAGDALRQLFGIPVFTSSQISITESPGGGDSSSIFVVDLTRVVVGTRQEMTLLIDPYSRSANDQVVVQMTTRWAMAVIDAAAVEIVAGCQP